MTYDADNTKLARLALLTRLGYKKTDNKNYRTHVMHTTHNKLLLTTIN